MAHHAGSAKRQHTIKSEEAIMLHSVDNYEEEVVNIFDVPVILREVLMRLDGNDLVRCSEVSKLWRHEALTVMRDWKRFLAPVEITKKVRRSKIACKDLKDLNDVVAGMQIVPFRGLAMVFLEDNHGPGICPAVENISEYYGDILSRIPMNSVQIGWLEVDDHSQEDRRKFLCPAIQLLLKIMKEHCHKLMGLTIDALPASVQLYTKEDLQTGNFRLPALRGLLMPIHSASDEYPSTLLDDLMSVAPQLGHLETILRGPQLEQFPKSKYDILRRLTLEMFTAKFENTYYNLALAQPKLVNLKIWPIDRVGRINFQKWMETLKLIFQSSSSYLKQLLIDSYTLSLLIKHKLCVNPLDQLENLEIPTGIDPAWISPTRKIISKLNFPTLFPNIKKVAVFATYPDPVLPPEISPSDREERLLDADDACLSTEYIKVLEITETRTSRRFRGSPVLRGGVFLQVAYTYWAKLFPHITSLTVNANCLHQVPYGVMWMKWQKLEELHLKLSLIETKDDARNYDALFCGIHSEEVRLLRKESKDFLRNVNLVTFPSITHLQSLKRLHVTAEEVSVARPRSTRKKLLWSRLTPLLAFARMKNLEDVRVITDDKKLFKHLFRHVEVTKFEDPFFQLSPEYKEN